MQIKTITVGPFEVNCYLCWDQISQDGVIVDPGFGGEEIIRQIEAAGMKPRAILLTHGHGDHIAAVKSVKDHFDLPLYVGRGDEKMLASPSENVSALVGEPIVAPEPDYLLDDEQVVRRGTISFQVLHTPGHTPGGVCYFNAEANLVFTGDTLFWGSVGRVDLPGGDGPTLINSIRTKLMPLGDEVDCYPGHGPATSIGFERNNNPFVTGQYRI
ncbi:MAG: MBL fold metallo-hydrolase [bacterium]